MEYKIMGLHHNKDLFRDAVLAASQRFGIPEIYIKKDYWVTLVLNKIFHSDMADQIVFKEGTCLSKCHQSIFWAAWKPLNLKFGSGRVPIPLPTSLPYGNIFQKYLF